MLNIGTTGLPAADYEDVRVLASIELSLKRWRIVARFSPRLSRHTRLPVTPATISWSR
jgi:hypothetical protein